MSDLVPFVAAVIRDKTIVDLQQELKAEKEKNAKLQKELGVIKVTGPDGFPVYAQRNIQYVHQVAFMEDSWDLELQNSTFNNEREGAPNANPTFPSCPIQDVENCELHIGGQEVVKLRDFDATDAVSSVGAETLSLLYMFQSQEAGGHKFTLTVDFGPNPDRDAVDVMDPRHYGDSGITYVRFATFECKRPPFDD